MNFFPFLPIHRMPRVLWVITAIFSVLGVGCDLKSADEYLADHPPGSDIGDSESHNSSGQDNDGDGGVGGPTGDDDSPPLPDYLPRFKLPFANGSVHQCTQGVNGDWSHQGHSTYYGLDFDTNNFTDEPIYAPLAGVAYIHGDANDTTGFGLSVCIALAEEDDLSICIGHLSDVFIPDGSWVERGEFLAYEGCSGNCTGDHIHYGLMEGNPAEDPVYSESVPMEIYARDVTAGGELEFIAAEDVVCGLSDGHHYESDFQVATWHPDGVLVQVPGDPKVYVTDRGALHWIHDEQVFWSYGFDFADVVPMSPYEFTCWDMGEPIMAPNCYRAVRADDGTSFMAYECQNNPGRYRLPIPAGLEAPIMGSWGISETEYATGALRQQLLDYPIGWGEARLRDGAIVREEGNDTLFSVNEGVAMSFDEPSVMRVMGMGMLPVHVVPEGRLDDAVIAVGECDLDQGCIDWTRVLQCGGYMNPDDVADGGVGGEDEEETPTPEDTSCDDDPDGDGVATCLDNCPLHDNPDQGDADADGLGDSCDTDIDGDGVSNADDCALFDPAVGECPPEEPAESDDDDAATPPDGDDDTHGDVDDPSEHADDDDSAVSDDDTVSDDDDATEDPAGDDDSTDEPEDLEENPTPPPTPDPPPVVSGTSILEISYTPPAVMAPYTYISLSGEYILVDGSYGLLWTSGLVTFVNASSLYFVLPNVAGGDTFRFSIEFYDAPMNYLNWACVPSSPYSTQGTLTVMVDGSPVPYTLINNFLGGCEDFVTIP